MHGTNKKLHGAKHYLVQNTGENIVFEHRLHIHIYINKGFNFNMNVIHSAPTKKSLSKSFFGLQPSGFRLSQAETFFY